jgi:hypothetical protein
MIVAASESAGLILEPLQVSNADAVLCCKHVSHKLSHRCQCSLKRIAESALQSAAPA